MSPRSRRFPGNGTSCESMTPALLVGWLPMPDTGQGPPFDVYPSDTVGSGMLTACAGRWRAASYRFWAARICRLLCKASSTSDARGCAPAGKDSTANTNKDRYPISLHHLNDPCGAGTGACHVKTRVYAEGELSRCEGKRYREA